MLVISVSNLYFTKPYRKQSARDNEIQQAIPLNHILQSSNLEADHSKGNEFYVLREDKHWLVEKAHFAGTFWLLIGHK